ncbi:MAG TPA: cold-shock protein [Bacteroidetes bacterium]|nr:cold shock protein 1 [bacterium BMS3Bbin03]HDK36473.1 cold-shock protein [Bacteroidota bacterium]
MQTGTVKSWEASKGYGFILGDDDEDYFVHVSDLDITLRDKGLREGLRVAFDVRSDLKGEKAVNVRVAR